MDRLPPQAVTGAAMDAVVPQRRSRLYLRAGATAALLLAFGAGAWQFMPHGLQVASADVRVAAAADGIFRDDIVVRASAQPLNSIMLDSVESGRVEEVLVEDGQTVSKGQLLFRLSNPQRNLALLERQAEHAQQISNLANLRVAQEAGRSEHRRRYSTLQFDVQQAEKQHARNVRLAQQGFISAVALEESADKLAQQRRALEDERRSIDTEEGVRQRGLQQMETAIDGLQSGLRLVSATVDALAVRAPSDGMLTDFRLQVGQTVQPNQNIGRIDDPKRFKLKVEIDEFYLSRVTRGLLGSVTQDGKAYPLKVSAVFPQIREGRFTAEMVFTGDQPAVISPGQSLDAQLTLGQAARALLLPVGAFVNDTGGAWVFVVDKASGRAEKRAVRLGRRNNSQVEVLSGLAPGEQVIISSYGPFGKAEQLQLN
ncbi:efflux RND transporter periplasmic adaptor subunit [Massilia sp. IC2-477]|uniref:efflux RND transporter periplasmic adaptor subunit n=1 Tax=Massilia sp. IC2-477 TaxID=2887198 RepID=UPI001D10EDA5|nr:efflux RND transporter periplasmic adaptor subunit [Massilia sp. IC2-477]MCC2957633.1 efflux RND transporter periplasmic adaptor subunit [Massilia sp. IC2-477]